MICVVHEHILSVQFTAKGKTADVDNETVETFIQELVNSIL